MYLPRSSNILVFHTHSCLHPIYCLFPPAHCCLHSMYVIALNDKARQTPIGTKVKGFLQNRLDLRAIWQPPVGFNMYFVWHLVHTPVRALQDPFTQCQSQASKNGREGKKMESSSKSYTLY